jgi:protein-S-isoprenylcysteine O-methyltransferase Ste14
MNKNKCLKLGHWLFKNRSFTPLPLLIISLWVFKPLWVQTSWGVILGISVTILGEGIRILTVGWSYLGTSGREAYLRADSLNTEGIYSLVRNPLYIGNIAIFLGLTLVYGNPWICLIMTLFLLTQYLLIVAAEEKFLVDKYGVDYQAYMKKVNRFIPKNFNFKVPQHPFSWVKVLLKENDSVFNMGLVLMSIIRYRIYHQTGSWGNVISIWLPIAVWVLIYGLIKIYKRRQKSA